MLVIESYKTPSGSTRFAILDEGDTHRGTQLYRWSCPTCNATHQGGRYEALGVAACRRRTYSTKSGARRALRRMAGE